MINSQAQEFRITNIFIDMQGKVRLEHEADTNSYYILYRGADITNIVLAVNMGLGQGNLGQLSDLAGNLTNASAFYRIRRLPVNRPLDTDGDGIDDVYELRRPDFLNPLNSADAVLDFDHDGLSNLEEYRRGTDPSTPPKAISMEPPSGSGEVGVTVRPKITFQQPIDTSTLNSNNFYAISAGHKLAAAIVPANNGAFAWLFLKDPMPNASQIQVVVDGSTIRNLDGTRLDAAGSNTPGSAVVFNFSTVSVTPIPNTVLAGQIVDPGPDLKPRTADDLLFGPDGPIYTRPIEGVKVFLLGLEDQAVLTDSNGNFRLEPIPVGDVKLVTDGRFATTDHPDFYWPEMVMDAHTEPDITNYWMFLRDSNGAVLRDGNGIPIPEQTMYLPRISSNILQNVIAANTTMIMLNSNGAYTLPSNQQQYLTLEIMPNSLIGMDGQPLATGQVGVSVVPTNLVRDMLPPGLLQHTFDITVQAPGIATFATPAPMTFPNVFNSPPGTKLNFLSFDHTTGRLVIEGTATVSADGLYVTTDPGTGVTHPGWHGLTPPGSKSDGQGKNSVDPFSPCGSPAHNRDLNPNYSQDVLNSLAANNRTIQSINSGSGDYLYDNYDVTVQMASGVTPEQFLLNMEKNLNGTVNSLGFNLINTFDVDQSPQLGDIYHINITAGLIGGDVVLSRLAPDHFTFTTLDGHPEFGAREFGFRRNNDGSVTFYTQGASRPKGPAEGSIGGFFQSKGWRNLTDGIGNTIKLQGGRVIGRSEVRHRIKGPSPCEFTPSFATERLVEPAGTTIIPASNRCFYRIQYSAFETNGAMQEVSGITDEEGNFSVFLAANAAYIVSLYNPVTKLHGEFIGETPNSGFPTSFGSIPIGTPDSSDSDGDGLGDFAEFVIGTNPNSPDSDNDGISDLAEVQQGTDPLSGRPVTTGVIASLPLQGVATDITIASSTNGGQQTAYIACGSGGLSIVNVSQFKSPVQLSQLNLSGSATSIAVDPTFNIAVIAANSGGLDFVDVSLALQPQVTLNISNNASAVQLVAGVVYAAVGNTMQAYDLLSGQFLQTLPLGSANITGMATEGFFVYTMDTAKTLRVIDVRSGIMVARGTLTLPHGGGGLFVGNDTAYVSATSDVYGGFLTVNTANPDGPVLMADSAASSSSASPGPNITMNGSGLGLVAVAGGLGVPPSLQVYDVTDPTNTGAFVTAYSLAAAPYKVAIGAGIGFVAGGTAGLQVLNYRSFDVAGIAPTIALSNSFPMTTLTNGIALEGNLVRVAAFTSDDVQLRNVEFYVEGTLMLSDQSFPFEYVFVTPPISATKTNFSLQARAFDTGGNSTWTPLVDVQLVQDTSPPRVRRLSPGTNGIVTGITNILVYFNKPLDGATVNSVTFSLLFAGPDHKLGTADDSLVTNSVVAYFGSLNAVQLSIYGQLAYGLYRATLSTNLMDAAGNALTNALSWVFWVLPGGPNGDDDHDGLTNALEITLGTDPLNPDTDGDGWSDGDERVEDTDPLDPLSHPSGVYVARPALEVTLPVTGGSSSSGISVARPQIEVTLPITGGFSGFGTSVAHPSVEITLPITGGASSLGTTLAHPQIEVTLPITGGANGTGTTVANPPITVITNAP